MVPDITVIMPVYNEEKYISESIESILNQTFTNFEFIIIDDGSLDRTVEIISLYSDKRIKLIQLKENRGNRFAANIGLKESKGKYIVRQDADDISLNNRLGLQFDFMENNPHIGLSGGGYKAFGKKDMIKHFPCNNSEIKVFFLFGNAVSQPTSIMRKDLIQDNDLYYSENGVSYAEDYQLFFKISQFSELANVNDILIKYRVHDSNTSDRLKEYKKEILFNLYSDILSFYFFKPNLNEIKIHYKLISNSKEEYNINDILKLLKWSKKIIKINNKNLTLDREILINYLLSKKERLFFIITKRSGWIYGLIYLILSGRFSYKKIRYLTANIFNSKN